MGLMIWDNRACRPKPRLKYTIAERIPGAGLLSLRLRARRFVSKDYSKECLYIASHARKATSIRWSIPHKKANNMQAVPGEDYLAVSQNGAMAVLASGTMSEATSDLLTPPILCLASKTFTRNPYVSDNVFAARRPETPAPTTTTSKQLEVSILPACAVTVADAESNFAERQG